MDLSNSQSVNPNASDKPIASGVNSRQRFLMANLSERVTSLPSLVPRAPNESRSAMLASRVVNRYYTIITIPPSARKAQK